VRTNSQNRKAVFIVVFCVENHLLKTPGAGISVKAVWNRSFFGEFEGCQIASLSCKNVDFSDGRIVVED
jgi:hypothetical protein